MENAVPQECEKHHKNICTICLSANCKERYLCSLCYRKHDNTHLQFFIPTNELYDKNKKIILFNDIEARIRKIKNAINEIKDNFYTKIDSLFTKYLKKLKEEKLEKYFESVFKKIDDSTGNLNFDNNL